MEAKPTRRILIAGATGYVGGRLVRGGRRRCLTGGQDPMQEARSQPQGGQDAGHAGDEGGEDPGDGAHSSHGG
jgi:hypothetical protein